MEFKALHGVPHVQQVNSAAEVQALLAAIVDLVFIQQLPVKAVALRVELDFPPPELNQLHPLNAQFATEVMVMPQEERDLLVRFVDKENIRKGRRALVPIAMPGLTVKETGIRFVRIVAMVIIKDQPEEQLVRRVIPMEMFGQPLKPQLPTTFAQFVRLDMEIALEREEDVILVLRVQWGNIQLEQQQLVQRVRRDRRRRERDNLLALCAIQDMEFKAAFVQLVQQVNLALEERV